ncbi:MAG: NADH-quinone oxidoreductase subunit M [Calditrichaeota bacterium]|nr:NADH-quinone oxidoreductase subunit M [Calditrichota bacterium]RQV98092.1 MAG: NADH-quinone oxidoreductase subunit M [Calditrichota bacterium]
MILVWIIALLMLGGILSLISGKWSHRAPRWISLAANTLAFLLVIRVWISNYARMSISEQHNWIIDLSWEWIPQFGIQFHLAMDGLSLLMVMLTLFLSIASILVSWTEITERVGFFHFNLMFIIAGIIGVFTALDLFLFYFFWEVMLIPMYFLIGIWGHENRIYASFKFFIFTQASGLLMFLSILALYFIHGQSSGEYTFDYMVLLGTTMSPAAARWIMAGFLIAFLVKLPAVPVHNWLPDAHTQAPTAGSVILAGLLLKTGAYGILRFVLPLFPDAAAEFAPVALLLGVISILYGAKLAYAQTDFRRLVAYTSVSHMGFVLLGSFAFNELALQGVIMQMISHGLSTGALFILAGLLQERIHTRDMTTMGGLWARVPRMGGIGMVFAMASLGLPGFGNFIAEFLILLGVYQSAVIWAILATLGLIASTIYSLHIIQRIFHGKPQKEWSLTDFNVREMCVMVSMVLLLLWIGIYPKPFLLTSRTSTFQIQKFLQPGMNYPDEYQSDKDIPPCGQNGSVPYSNTPSEQIDITLSKFPRQKTSLSFMETHGFRPDCYGKYGILFKQMQGETS